MLQKWKDEWNAAPKLRHQSPSTRFWESVTVLHRRRTSVIALFAATAILVHLVLRFSLRTTSGIEAPRSTRVFHLVTGANIETMSTY